MSLEARLVDVVFGEDGLLVRTARIEGTLQQVLDISTQTNDRVGKMNGTVADLARYRDALPAAERDPLVRKVRQHLDDSAEAKHRTPGWKWNWNRFAFDVLRTVVTTLTMIFLAVTAWGFAHGALCSVAATVCG